MSTVELDRGGDSYTVDTLVAVQAASPDDEHWLIRGSDVAQHLDTWDRPDSVRSVSHRDGDEWPGSVAGRPPSGCPF